MLHEFHLKWEEEKSWWSSETSLALLASIKWLGRCSSPSSNGCVIASWARADQPGSLNPLLPQQTTAAAFTLQSGCDNCTACLLSVIQSRGQHSVSCGCMASTSFRSYISIGEVSSDDVAHTSLSRGKSKCHLCYWNEILIWKTINFSSSPMLVHCLS